MEVEDEDGGTAASSSGRRSGAAYTSPWELLFEVTVAMSKILKMYGPTE